MISHCLLMLMGLAGQADPVAGSISGRVINATREKEPVAGAEIVLRVRVDGQFVVAAEGFADEQGWFLFDNIPAAADYVYLPGANHHGVHYPGPRVRITSQTPHARVMLDVHDTVADDCPLRITRHEITIRQDEDALHVHESLMIDNSSALTYVGRPAREGGRATTMQVSIPSDFRRTTFDKEFYGRQFTLIDGRLVTDLPWTPGERRLEFTYVLPRDGHRQLWQRPIDLDCDELRIEVFSTNPDHVSCNLPLAATSTNRSVIFETDGNPLPAGTMVQVELGRVHTSVASYGRWLALAILAGLIGVTLLLRAKFVR